VEVPFVGSTESAHPPVVRVSGRAQAELRAGEALVFDWIRLAFCCAVAGEVSLRPTTLQEARRLSVYVPLSSEDGPLVFAHRRAYPMLVGRDIEIDCRRWGCAPPSDATSATDLVTAGSAPLRALMLPWQTSRLGLPARGCHHREVDRPTP
jgi:hypothetical protein